MSEKEEFRLLRLKKRITLTELAEYIKCSRCHIGNYENRRANMDYKKVRKYKKYILEKRVDEK